MDNIEVEVRSFVDETKYRELLAFFERNGKLIKHDNQETWYFDAPKDLRLQKGSASAKVWLKEGRIYDDAREEVEIKFGKDDFERMAALFASLGYGVKIKWFRDRRQFDWDGIKVCLDSTKGYGFIVELERLTSPERKETELKLLRAKLAELDVAPTPKEEFEKRFEHYSKNWRKLVK